MNTIYNRFFAWGLSLLMTVCFAACSDDDESPFSGSDAHIVSLTLTATDGTVYPVSIVNDTLLLKLPNNISLSGAKATYEICEQASIIPDPSDVTDWGEEQMFRLVSYSGEVYANYRFVIKREAISNEGSVNLTTQAELDAFGEKGINEVNGNLVIGSPLSTDDPILNLKALSSLTKVSGTLIILSSYEGGNLEGLENITELGGIMIGTENASATITTAINMNLPAVKKIGDIFINSNSIKTLQLPSITNASSICVTSSILEDVDLSNLKSCSGEFSFGRNTLYDQNNTLKKLLCPQLEEIGGDFILNYLTALTKSDFSKVSKIGGSLKCAYLNALEELNFSELSTFENDLTLTSLLAAKTINLSKVKTVANYNVSGFSDWAVESLDLSSLETVTGSFYQTAKSPNLENFSLPLLSSVGGNMSVSTMANILSLSFPELTKVDGALSLATMTSLKKLSLPKLTDVKSSVTINLQEMESMDISSLTSFTAMTLNSVKKMSEVHFSKSMDKFPGTLTIANTCTSIKKIVGPKEYAGNVTVTLPTISVVPAGGDIQIPTFTTASNELVTMDGNLTISATRATDTFALDGVKTVVGKLTLPYCKAISLENVTSVGSLAAGSYSGVMEKLSAPLLEVVEGDFNISYRGYSSFDLPKLTQVGNFMLNSSKSYSNTTLANLNDFAALRTITGNVTIQYYTALADYSGLSGVTNFAGKWTVANNKVNLTLSEFNELCSK